MKKNLIVPIAIIVVAITLLVFIQKPKTSFNKPNAVLTSDQVSSTISNTPAATVTQEPTLGVNQQRYSSELGVSFIYSTKSLGVPVAVKADGRKIYVYFANSKFSEGQYIEVFQKSPQDSLIEAIQKQFLKNISSTDCFVKDINGSLKTKYPSTYELKTLGYKTDPNSDIPAFAQENKCPVSYAETNGISYFLSDTKHPDIFLFVSIALIFTIITFVVLVKGQRGISINHCRMGAKSSLFIWRFRRRFITLIDW